MVTSFGVLLFKREAASCTEGSIQFLLGMIPQRNWWTVFKGLPASDDESPHETAVREFEEETGSNGLLLEKTRFQPLATLHGRAGKKKLEIFLLEGSFFDTQQHFCLEKVVKIDSGYMQGEPEIVGVRWMTLEEALNGVDGAKIYTSQRNIIQEAHEILMKRMEEEPSAEDCENSVEAE